MNRFHFVYILLNYFLFLCMVQNANNCNKSATKHQLELYDDFHYSIKALVNIKYILLDIP